MGNISDKGNTYSFGGHYVKSHGHMQFLWGFFFSFLSLMLHSLFFFLAFFTIPFSNATLNQISFDPFQTWNMDNMSDMGNTYCFWGHFVKGHGHFHGQFSGQNSYNIIPIQYKFAVAGPYLTWSVF